MTGGRWLAVRTAILPAVNLCACDGPPAQELVLGLLPAAESRGVIATSAGSSSCVLFTRGCHCRRRVNTINGRKYAEDPTIFAWNLINEPRCYACGTRLQVDDFGSNQGLSLKRLCVKWHCFTLTKVVEVTIKSNKDKACKAF